MKTVHSRYEVGTEDGMDNVYQRKDAAFVAAARLARRVNPQEVYLFDRMAWPRRANLWVVYPDVSARVRAHRAA